ncbi:MAG: hypothetical protein FWB74_08405 [Defluviitaleaceae bacterium]|nr:hypothetical protein [Defluviitaleaceae bacterium]
MKKLRLLVLLAAVLAVAAACVYDYEGNGSLPALVEQQFESSIPLDFAEDIFAQMQALWDADNGDLWGFSLHAPAMFACAITRHVVANMPDPLGALTRHGDVYVGLLPDDIFAGNTIVDWNGLTWGMGSWMYLGMNLEAGLMDEISILTLMVHEAFHALQEEKIVHGGIPEAFFDPSGEHVFDQSQGHINSSADARIAVILEFNALMAALNSQGDERLQAIHDALAIRAWRRYLTPHGVMSENFQEILEGLAVFTEILVFGTGQELLSRYAHWVTPGMGTQLGGFPYFTGAIYALLLKEMGANWRQGITFETDLAALLQEHLGITTIAPIGQVDLNRYGYVEVAATERAWMEEFTRLSQAAEDFFNAPTVFLEGISDFASFTRTENFRVDDPSEYIVGLWHLIMYGEFSMLSANWYLEINGGLVRMQHFPVQGIHIELCDNIEISEDGRRATAPTWTLEITSGNYTIQRAQDGGIVIN